MIKPGWRRRNDVCPQCHMPGRVSERVRNGEPAFIQQMGDMTLYMDICDNCGVVYAYKADERAVIEGSRIEPQKLLTLDPKETPLSKLEKELAEQVKKISEQTYRQTDNQMLWGQAYGSAMTSTVPWGTVTYDWNTCKNSTQCYNSAADLIAERSKDIAQEIGSAPQFMTETWDAANVSAMQGMSNLERFEKYALKK